jgi:hypothetical protein
MKTLSLLVAFPVAICGLVFTESPASATAANITGTWELTIHYPPPDGDYQARYVLKQDGEKITGTDHGMYGPAEVIGTERERQDDGDRITGLVHESAPCKSNVAGEVVDEYFESPDVARRFHH